jgi:predicted CoA-binding protein
MQEISATPFQGYDMPMLPINSRDAMCRALASRTIAVVGLSSDPARPSYGVARYLQRQGYRIIPVNPYEQLVLGERAYPHLRAVPVPVDVVNVFRRPEYVPEVVADAIAVGARALWLQFGVIHEEAARRAQAAGLAVVMDRCIKVEHARQL